MLTLCMPLTCKRTKTVKREDGTEQEEQFAFTHFSLRPPLVHLGPNGRQGLSASEPSRVERRDRARGVENRARRIRNDGWAYPGIRQARSEDRGQSGCRPSPQDALP